MLRIAAAVLTALLLSGCAGPAGPAGAPSATPSVTPSAAPVSTAPGQTLDLACPDVMPADDLTLLFGQAYTPASESSLLTHPYDASLRNAGATSCRWDSQVGQTDFFDPDRDVLAIRLLPGTTAERWDEYASVYPQNPSEEAFGDGSGSNCYADENRQACYSDILVGGVWIEMHLEGVNLPDGTTGDAGITSFVRPIIERLVDRVAAASVLAAPSPTEITPRTDCATIFPLDGVREVLEITDDGVARDLKDGEGGGGLNLSEDARTRAGLTTCIVAPRRSEFSWAEAVFLPKGAWAFEPAAVAGGLWDDAELVDVDGADTAYEECPLDGRRCRIDLAIGGSWVRVTVTVGEGDNTVVSAEHRAHIRALAALVTANVT